MPSPIKGVRDHAIAGWRRGGATTRDGEGRCHVDAPRGGHEATSSQGGEGQDRRHRPIRRATGGDGQEWMGGD